jgi:hypothetical protein
MSIEGYSRIASLAKASGRGSPDLLRKARLKYSLTADNS